MQSIIRLSLLLSVLVIVSTFIGGLARAAEVVKVNAGKEQIYIDQGKDAGFVMGSEVCIFSEQGEKITCGQVRQTSEGRAMVRVPSRFARKIKRGMTARLVISETVKKAD